MKLYKIYKNALDDVKEHDGFYSGHMYICEISEKHSIDRIVRLSSIYLLSPYQIRNKLENLELIPDEDGNLICSDKDEAEKYVETYIWNRTYNTDEDMPEGLA